MLSLSEISHPIKIIHGEVNMRVRHVGRDRERGNGRTLACQEHANAVAPGPSPPTAVLAIVA